MFGHLAQAVKGILFRLIYLETVQGSGQIDAIFHCLEFFSRRTHWTGRLESEISLLLLILGFVVQNPLEVL